MLDVIFQASLENSGHPDCHPVILHNYAIFVFQLDCVIVLGSFGGRLDQIFSNIETLFTAKTIIPETPVYLYSQESMACLLSEVKFGIKFRFPTQMDTLSRETLLHSTGFAVYQTGIHESSFQFKRKLPTKLMEVSKLKQTLQREVFLAHLSRRLTRWAYSIRNQHKGNKLPSVHVLGDFNFKDIDWPDRLNKSGVELSQSERKILIAIMNDHGLEQLVHFPTWEKNTLDLILTCLPVQFQDIHSPDKLSDHDIVSGTLKVIIPPIKKPRRKVYLYQKGDFESMRKDAFEFAKEKYFGGHSDTHSVQEIFDLITSFIQDSADKHIPSKTSRSVSSVQWITPEIRRKIPRKNKTHAKAKKTGSSKLRSKFETLKRLIKADVWKQHDLYVNNLVGDVKANPKDFYRYINSPKKDTQGIPPLKSRTLKRQRNLMVNLRMCSIKMNTPRSRFWIGLSISWTILLFLKME